MLQQITITSDTPVTLRPLIESAIRSELQMLDLGLEKTDRRLRSFEQQYDMASDEFERRFNTGEAGDVPDFMEWAGEIKTLRLLKASRQALQGARLN